MWGYHIFTCEDIVSFLSICYHSVYHWPLYNKIKYSHFCQAAQWSLVMYIEMFWLLTARLFIRQWGLLVNLHHLLSRMLHCDWLVFSSFGWCTSIFTLLVCSSLSGQLSTVTQFTQLLCFLIAGIHASRISIALSLLMLLGWSLMFCYETFGMLIEALDSILLKQWGSKCTNHSCWKSSNHCRASRLNGDM